MVLLLLLIQTISLAFSLYNLDTLTWTRKTFHGRKETYRRSSGRIVQHDFHTALITRPGTSRAKCSGRHGMPLYSKHGPGLRQVVRAGYVRQRRVTRAGLPLARRAMPAIIRMRVTSNANYLFISLRMQPRRHAASVPIRSGAPWSCCALGLYTLDFGLADNYGDYKNVRFASLVFLVIGLTVDFDILVSYVVSYVVSWLPPSLPVSLSLSFFLILFPLSFTVILKCKLRL